MFPEFDRRYRTGVWHQFITASVRRKAKAGRAVLRVSRGFAEVASRRKAQSKPSAGLTPCLGRWYDEPRFGYPRRNIELGKAPDARLVAV